MDGVDPEPVPETASVTEAVVSLKVAVIVPEPAANCDPVTASVAVAVPAEPVSVAEPSCTFPAANVTIPVGVGSPVTVAIRYTVSDAPTLLRLGRSVNVFPDFGWTGAGVHPVIN